MQNLPVITWRTTKTTNGFAWEVYSFGHQIPECRLSHGLVRTRAIATTCARKMTRWHKAQQAKLIAA